jgi:hypothetical protein
MAKFVALNNIVKRKEKWSRPAGLRASPLKLQVVYYTGNFQLRQSGGFSFVM